MERALIVPAGGIGSRLKADTPKLLVRVDGKMMIEHLLDLYAEFVDAVALVVHPTALDRTREIAGAASMPVDVFMQETPTGMLDAILLARPAIERWRPRRVWITWCDQIAIHPQTVARLADIDNSENAPVLTLPTSRAEHPYIHLVRNEHGEIVDILHRREGDAMPDVGEGDAGLFDLSLRAYLDWLPEYAASPSVGARTGERNFVPFVATARRHGPVRTFSCVDPMEAVGVNTPEDLARVEAHLRARSAATRA